jgi:hypothetical protein
MNEEEEKRIGRLEKPRNRDWKDMLGEDRIASKEMSRRRTTSMKECNIPVSGLVPPLPPPPPQPAQNSILEIKGTLDKH